MTAQELQDLVTAARFVQEGLTKLIGESERSGYTNRVNALLATKRSADQVATRLTWVDPD